MKRLKSEQHIDNQTVATIGFFDGVHRGHQFLLQELQRHARQYALESLVVSFNNSPLATLRPEKSVMLLTTSHEKTALFAQAAIDNCLLLDFDKNLSQLTAREFLTWLSKNYGVQKLLVGYDHRFGSDGISLASDYQTLGNELGIDIVPCPRFDSEEDISSSAIRNYIARGNVEQANECLGYRYAIEGVVVQGQQIGRKIGFPTANLLTNAEKLIPKNGVYAVEINHNAQIYKGLLNIGMRPTVEGNCRTIEVHLLDFEGDLYGERLTLHIEKRLRDEYKFASLDELKNQIEKDIATI